MGSLLEKDSGRQGCPWSLREVVVESRAARTSPLASA